MDSFSNLLNLVEFVLSICFSWYFRQQVLHLFPLLPERLAKARKLAQ